jgi:hypothetical protein
MNQIPDQMEMEVKRSRKKNRFGINKNSIKITAFLFL